ncbi:MAG: glycosyl hydrolase 43 family protein [Chitinophagaceae bacterium]|nr:MAG: glycosyl hydrolase 43 family protein [Chitinophagaceae bacterium]
MRLVNIILFLILALPAWSQKEVQPWVPDMGDGNFRNPVLHADYSDPDVIRVGSDFYMIASSFNASPGLPILHSKDLVNWAIIGHALQRQSPEADFIKVQHGIGVWAPSIRYHNKIFYIYFPDPDQGIFLTKATSINGPWSKPLLVEAGKGLIDPCPLWDTNGKAYMVHAYAGSRAGFKSIIVAKEMNAAGDSIIGNTVMVYDGHGIDPTIEGPKIHKRNNYYYIFAPAGGVSTGWQLVLRSKNIFGPYERRVVMQQGSTAINGPHQGAWVDTEMGGNWFLHFQDKDAYGRIVHLQPLQWKNDWPVIGADIDGDGIGEPVSIFKKPAVAKPVAISVPATSDEFDKPTPGLQWQWQANPQPGYAFGTSNGTLRMFCLKKQDTMANHWMLPNMLTQKLPAESFSATVKLHFKPANINDRTALTVFGVDYAYISLVKKEDAVYISYNSCIAADKNKPEKEILLKKWTGEQLYFRVMVSPGAICHFSYSEDGKSYQRVEETFSAKPGKWVGAKLGLFSTGTAKTNDAGYTDVDWFRIGS